MKTTPKISPEMEDEDLKDMTLLEFIKGYFIYLYTYFIRPR
jgi:hypothetical protein